MAVLGVGGKVRLRREAPEPMVLRPGNIDTASNSIYLRSPAFWSGDHITISSANGLPVDVDDGSNGPDCPDGHAMYFESEWHLGTNRDHITNENDDFYTGTNTDQFYMREEECGLTTSQNYYIYRDQLDKVSFYSTRAAALLGRTTDRVQLFKVDFNSLIISAVGTTEYNSAITECATDIGGYNFSDAQDEVTLDSICDFAPDYEDPPAFITEYDNADLTPRYYVNAGPTGALWMLQCDMSQWSLNMNAPEVDTTSVGEKFGESIKSLVSGGGSIDFYIDRKHTSNTEQGSTALMQLLLLTEKGCNADAEFWMVDSAEDRTDVMPGDLYYSTQILITSVAVNTRSTDVIAGSANFVTVGEIALRMGTN